MNPTEPTWKSYIVETTQPIFSPKQCQLVINKGMSLKKETAAVGMGQKPDGGTDPEKRMTFLNKTGQKTVDQFAKSYASAVANKAVYGDQTPRVTNVNIGVPDFSEMSTGTASYMSPMESAANYQSNMYNGNMYGSPSVWFDWQQWASDFRANQQNVVGASQ